MNDSRRSVVGSAQCRSSRMQAIGPSAARRTSPAASDSRCPNASDPGGGAISTPSERRACVHGHSDGASASSWQLPQPTSMPRAAHRSLRARTSAVLPRPASPSTTRVRKWPSIVAATAESTWASSPTRSTRSVAGAGRGGPATPDGAGAVVARSVGDRAGVVGATSSGSWARMRRSSSARSGPGSSPSSSASLRRTSWYRSSASAWRPVAYRARIRSAHRASRSGSSRTAASSSATAVLSRPSSTMAVSRSSSHDRRSSSSRATVAIAKPSFWNSSSAGPRHRASACVVVSSASANAPSSSAARPADADASKRDASTASFGRSSR